MLDYPNHIFISPKRVATYLTKMLDYPNQIFISASG
jgi:hypothetical protein